MSDSLKPIYTVIAEEPLLAFEAMGALRTQAREAGFSDRTILAVESGFDWGHLYQACKSNSLFSEKSWVELRLSSGKPGTEGARHLESIHQLSHPDLILLVLLPALDYATRQSQWFKSLSKNTHLINAEAVHRHQLPRWIAQRLALQKQQANPDTLAFLVEHVEGHLLAAHQEILKLGLLFPPGLLPDDAVRQAVLDVSRHVPDDLVTALLNQDATRFLRVLRSLEDEGVAAPLVLWVLTEKLRVLHELSLARQSGIPSATVLKEFRIRPSDQKGLTSLAARISHEQCSNALAMAGEVDRMIKGVVPGSPWSAMLGIALELLAAPL